MPAAVQVGKCSEDVLTCCEAPKYLVIGCPTFAESKSGVFGGTWWTIGGGTGQDRGR